MNIEGFQRIAGLDEVSPKRPKRILVGEQEIVLFRVGHEIFAVENVCPHQKFSVFHQAVLDDYTMTCPMHGWSFDVRTGKNVTGNGRLKIFEIRIQENDVWLKMPIENPMDSLF